MQVSRALVLGEPSRTRTESPRYVKFYHASSRAPSVPLAPGPSRTPTYRLPPAYFQTGVIYGEALAHLRAFQVQYCTVLAYRMEEDTRVDLAQVI